MTALESNPPEAVAAETEVETPSGKGSGDENFPVGSWLLPARLRPHVAVYYAFARAIDDIADNPELTADQKIERLQRFEDAVTGREAGDPGLDKAHRLRRTLGECGIPARHATDLIAAFKQDAVKSRYDDWDDLLGYCERSANPVGRFLLDLHGEDRAGYRHADALCSALQVINHLQDCGDDYRNLDRVYLPGDWMAAAGVDVAALDAPAASAGLRQVMDRCLAGVDELLAVARMLPAGLRSRHLALESAVIVRLAERLSRELKRRDPLAERVELSKPQVLACALQGVGGTLWRRWLGGRPSAEGANNSERSP